MSWGSIALWAHLSFRFMALPCILYQYFVGLLCPEEAVGPKFQPPSLAMLQGGGLELSNQTMIDS